MKTQTPCGVVILAAGQGKRMRSNLPKVLNPIAGKPLLFHVLNQVNVSLPGAPVALVVGHGRDQVETYVRQEQESLLKDLKIDFIIQPHQLGTGDAARCVIQSPWGKARIEAGSSILVLSGDTPLMSSELLKEMAAPLAQSEALRLLSCHLSEPKGYGRIIRKNGKVAGIVEEKDATLDEKKIQEVGVSTYLFNSTFLSEKVTQLSNQNAQKEYYLTDLVAKASESGQQISSLVWAQEEDIRGVNDLWELSQAHAVLKLRCLKKWAQNGVRILDPQNTCVEVTVELEEGVTLYPGVILEGMTRVGKGSVLGPNVYLKDVVVGENVHLKTGTVAENSKIAAGAFLGPYAHLRPESEVGASAKIGNFVELKKTKVGDHSSVAHLSYLGDAEVGKNVNIGCGFVTCNFDGRVIDGQRKHRTIIEDDVFLGSDCQAVAPIRIGKGAYIASGSTITEDVPSESLAIARSRQVNKPGYARKLRKSKQES